MQLWRLHYKVLVEVQRDIRQVYLNFCFKKTFSLPPFAPFLLLQYLCVRYEPLPNVLNLKPYLVSQAHCKDFKKPLYSFDNNGFHGNYCSMTFPAALLKNANRNGYTSAQSLGKARLDGFSSTLMLARN